jgi:hypothetical protein
MMKTPEKPIASELDGADETSSSWPIYEKDQTGADKSLERWCDILWGTSIITGKARVELVLEFMREWYRNTDYDWRSFYEDIATRSDLFPDEAEMDRFIRLPVLPPTFDLKRFLELLDRWDDLLVADTPIEQAAAEIASCGVVAEATSDTAHLRINGVTVDSEPGEDLPSKLDVLETVCAMKSCRLLRSPEEADDDVRFENLKICINRYLK